MMMASQQIRIVALRLFSARTGMASLPKKRCALVMEFFDPSNMNGAIQCFLRAWPHWAVAHVILIFFQIQPFLI